MDTLTVNVADFEDLPEFKAEGWNAHLDARMRHGKCFAYALDDQSMAILPGKGNERITENTSMIESLMGSNIALTAPPGLPYEGNLANYATKQWQNMVKRDGMIPVEPDENGVLNVPEGASLLFLAVQQKLDPLTRDMKPSRHWYRADRPHEGSDQVTFSHWDGDSTPKRYTGMDNITNPWKQCAFDKYQPVGYFLVASKKTLEEQSGVQNVVAAKAMQSTALTLTP